MRYGFAPNQVDNVLYDAFGQRTVSTIFNPFNPVNVVIDGQAQTERQPFTVPNVIDPVSLAP